MLPQSLWPSSFILVSNSRKAPISKKSFQLFSTLPRLRRQVRMRRDMFQWMNRMGKSLREPLESSTNYLGAYAVSGNLRRVEERTMEHTREVERLRNLSKNNPDKRQETEYELQKENEKYSLASNTLPPTTRRDMMPFPANKEFISEPVLGPFLQNEIWADVVKKGLTVREVSSLRGVEMSRVAAVVRLLEVEKEWKEQGKEIAESYTSGVLEMLPYTGRVAMQSWSDEDEGTLKEMKLNAKVAASRETKEIEDENVRRKQASLPLLPLVQPIIPDDNELKQHIIEKKRRAPHESINDLPILKVTGAQMWLPVSESRRFTRKDAAKAFNDKLQPADKRVPHPELTQIHKEWLAGKTLEERVQLQDSRAKRERQKIAQRAAKKILQEDSIKKVTNKRGVVFRFNEINVDDIGRDGRSIKGVGCRYGVPNMDRSKGDLKIPQHALAPPRYMPISKVNLSQGA